MKDSFASFVRDQLEGLGDLRVKRMFGGHGFYLGDRFFGILMEGRLYFKTDDQTRLEYVKRGMPPFIYEKARRTMTITYFEVPPDILEERDELVRWARQAAEAARTK